MKNEWIKGFRNDYEKYFKDKGIRIELISKTGSKGKYIDIAVSKLNTKYEIYKSVSIPIEMFNNMYDVFKLADKVINKCYEKTKDRDEFNLMNAKLEYLLFTKILLWKKKRVIR